MDAYNIPSAAVSPASPAVYISSQLIHHIILSDGLTACVARKNGNFCFLLSCNWKYGVVQPKGQLTSIEAGTLYFISSQHLDHAPGFLACHDLAVAGRSCVWTCRKLIVSRTAHARGFDSIELLFLLRFPSSQSRGCVCMYVYWCRLQSRGLTYSACWAQNKLSPQIYEHKNKYETR